MLVLYLLLLLDSATPLYTLYKNPLTHLAGPQAGLTFPLCFSVPLCFTPSALRHSALKPWFCTIYSRRRPSNSRYKPEVTLRLVEPGRIRPAFRSAGGADCKDR